MSGNNAVVIPEDDLNLKPIEVQAKLRLSLPNDSVQNDVENTPKSLKVERSKSLYIDEFDSTARRFSNLGNWTGAVILSQILVPSKKRGKWYSYQHIFQF